MLLKKKTGKERQLVKESKQIEWRNNLGNISFICCVVRMRNSKQDAEKETGIVSPRMKDFLFFCQQILTPSTQ